MILISLAFLSTFVLYLAMEIQYILEVLGTGFFAISGALAANDKAQPDWFGASFIGFITAIGGGSLRDILLGKYPLVWINDINFVRFWVCKTGVKTQKAEPRFLE